MSDEKEEDKETVQIEDVTTKDMGYHALSTLVVKQKTKIKELEERLKLQKDLRKSDVDVVLDQEKEIEELKKYNEKQLKMVTNNIPEHEKQTSFVKVSISVKGVITGEAKCYDDDMNVAWDKTKDIIKRIQSLNMTELKV